MLRVDMLNTVTLVVVVVVACGFLENSHCWLRACVLVWVGVFAIDGDARCVCGHDTIQTVDWLNSIDFSSAWKTGAYNRLLYLHNINTTLYHNPTPETQHNSLLGYH